MTEYTKGCLNLAYDCLKQAHLRLQMARMEFNKTEDPRVAVKLCHAGEIAQLDVLKAIEIISELDRSNEIWENREGDLNSLDGYAQDLKRASCYVAIGRWKDVVLPSRLRNPADFV